MKILNINKSDRTGGAAVAAMRLVKALRKSKIDTHILVEDKLTSEEFVYKSRNGWLNDKFNFINFVKERLYFYPHEKDSSVRFAFSPAIAGHSLLKHIEVQNANLLHFHWFNQGFLSLKNFQALTALNKPIVWTLHDMWSFTGGCHYSSECYNYKINCGECPLLKHPSKNDLSFKTLKRKEFIKQIDKLTIVTCSDWLANKARESSLFKNHKVISIPNPIDIEHFSPQNINRTDHQLPINKKIVLFGAANINDSRKGFKFLIEALELLPNKKDIHLLLFGKAGAESLQQIPFPYTHIPFADYELIVKLYNLADIMVLPSLQDNLPNTIMESMACGTPVAAFTTGGIPEMIQHKTTGFLSSPQNTDELAEGISFTLKNKEELGKAARTFVEENYSEVVVAQKYKNEYLALLNE